MRESDLVLVTVFVVCTGEVVRESDLVLVAVKPLVAEAVFAGLGAALTDGRERCVVSLVTGWSRQRIIKVTRLHTPLAGRPSRPDCDTISPPGDARGSAVAITVHTKVRQLLSSYALTLAH